MAQVVGGVQAPKYIYLPNATIRYNKLNYNYPVDTTPYKTYTRPGDWLDLPVVNEGDEVIYMLVAVYENSSNDIVFSVRGNYTVDWGDGNIVNYNANHTSSSHVDGKTGHSINWDDIDPSTLTSEGYRQAIVKITPQVPGELTHFNNQLFNQSMLNGVYGGLGYSGLLDMKMAGQNISYLRVGGSYNPKFEQFEFVGTHSIVDGNYMFQNSSLRKIVSLDLSNTTSGYYMFRQCSKLIELPENLDTSSITITYDMFSYCSSLEKLPTLDLSSCTNMTNMFYNSTQIREINLTNTSNVTNGQSVFYGCSKLVKITGLDTSSMTTAHQMFAYCTKLMDIPEINLQSCTTAANMFKSCSSIIRFDNGIINTSGTTNMQSMFSGCGNLIEIPKDFDTSAATNMSYMFQTCSSLRRIPLLNTSNNTTGYYMFRQSGIEEIPELDFSNITHAGDMFAYCYNLKTLPTLDLSSCTSMQNMFYNCREIREINLTNTSNVTSGLAAFYGCSNLIKITGLDTSSMTTTHQMFYVCSKLMDIPEINLQSCTRTSHMFYGCSSLEGFPNGIINTSGVTNMQSMFSTCGIKELPSDFNTDSATLMTYMFQSTPNLKTIPPINTSNITSGYYMFRGSEIEEIPDLDTSNITDSREMIGYCYRLRKIGGCKPTARGPKNRPAEGPENRLQRISRLELKKTEF